MTKNEETPDLPDLPDLIGALLRGLGRAGPEKSPPEKSPALDGAWLVGGTVRDILLCRQIRDADVALKGDPCVSGDAAPGVDGSAAPRVGVFAVARGFADRIGGTFFVMSERFPTARVEKKTAGGRSVTFDFSALRGGSIEEDLRARDFTVNAMAIPLKNLITHLNPITGGDIDVGATHRVNGGATHRVNPSDVIDVTGGLGDLKNGIVRMVSRSNLVEDPLRLLRAYRFSCELGFTMDAATAGAIAELKGLIARAAPERTMAELRIMLSLPRSGAQIYAMAQSGLLFEIIPEAAGMGGMTQKGVRPPASMPHHPDVFERTMAAYFQAERLMEDEGVFMRARLDEYFCAEPHRRAFLKFSMLLRDVGKPVTRAEAADGGMIFHGRKEEGARTAAEVCARLKTSGMEAGYVTKMVRERSRIPRLFSRAGIDAGSAPGREAVKLLRDAGDDLYGLIVMSLADNAAEYPDGGVSGAGPRAERMTKYCRGLIAFYEGDFKLRAGRPRFLTGGDIIARFKLSPSPLIGEILDRIEQSTLEGAIKNRGEALAEAEKVLSLLKGAAG